MTQVFVVRLVMFAAMVAIYLRYGSSGKEISIWLRYAASTCGLNPDETGEER